MYEALCTPENKLDSVKYIENLITKMKEIETPTDDEYVTSIISYLY